MLRISSTSRFSSRVQNYARYRPSYPPDVLEVLRHECGLSRDSIVADIASGTGIFTRLLLENGNRVFGVEPNPDMRSAGEEYLAGYPKFASVSGTAEATTLPDHRVTLITSAQAAHWFDREKALLEFRRILCPEGYVALLWNERQVGATAFGTDYENLLVKYGTDYIELQNQNNGPNEFFPFKCGKRVLNHRQVLEYAALEGLLLSASYTPQPGEASYAPMLAGLRQIFEQHQIGGFVRMEYETRLYFGQLSRSD